MVRDLIEIPGASVKQAAVSDSTRAQSGGGNCYRQGAAKEVLVGVAEAGARRAARSTAEETFSQGYRWARVRHRHDPGRSADGLVDPDQA